MTNEQIRERLLSLRDEKYAEFQSRLMPTVPTERVIGVRTPLLRSFAKEIIREGDYREFLSALPHKYYEEDNLHGFILEGIKDYGECVKEIERFVPHMDNWATCDCTRPKVLKKDKEKTLSLALKFIESDRTYTVRYGIGLLMSFYLDGDFSPEHLKIISQIRSDEYYVNMMIAWYFATALSKQYESTMPYIENKVLPVWVHNKTIQKAVESYRISEETKKQLKTLRIK